ncbi:MULTISPECIES: DUF6600 domain-containing protein [unclassified Mesorhizobium]|uniref:DUF6600 domain-containing protein n=1 Tax=unclassified Mesorhizobium TaxID=325217 RepID=UPI0003CFD71C|nr:MULTISPECIES: DUF6600 domain-containing protein [unclassified Mesorhizobium]ESZ19296.1 hypothetical protein X737_15980 [Mesorhizobium sp. L48C026A00]RWN79308.1 MAG: hypothetical protein EOS02_07115 [Mesorhizobium sp.]RWN84865.1 MAG: hypothetical protein EOS01_02445 [Mesorhizobium sp.]RWN92984.1 MAG: hypothetical protein EOS04_02435 [Mesorhizobium sp.]RWO17214.1 MAG: hypothetical protein EOS15_01260 [Mesorhizobium sp.]
MKRVLAQNAVRLMLGGVAAGLLTIVEIPNPVAPLSLVSEARAATDVSVSISTFYDKLSSHGDWVSYRGATVFVPVDVADDWRPYTIGHWVYTEQHGWLWVSDEPFGWATYHYGRWGYADDIGWYWVPGTRWAPAWVSWRREREHVIWAPLPPRRDPDLISIEVTIDTTPDFYWVVVPTREFLADDISVVVIRDEPEFVRIVEAAEPAGDVTIQNNVVINKVIDVDVIEKETDEQVTVVEVSETETPEQAGKVENNTVTVFEGEVKADPEAKPAELKDIEEVKQVQAGRKSKPTEGAATTEQAPDDEVKPEETAKPEKPTEEQPAAEQEQAEPEETGKPEKPTTEEQPAAEQEQAEPEKAAKPEKPKAKEQPAAEQEQAEPEQAAKPEKPKAEEQPAAEQQQAEPEQAEPKPQQQENKACDPQTGANC